MKKGKKVTWKIDAGTYSPVGNGVTLSDEEDGHVIVAVNVLGSEQAPLGYHPVIYCAVTWLTVVPEPAPVPATAPEPAAP